MRIIQSVIVFNISFLIINCSNVHTLLKNDEIDSKIEYFSFYLSEYNPNDIRVDKDSLKKELVDFIKIFESKHYKKRDKYYYYCKLGDLYRFAYNLDIDDSWLKCYDYYRKAIILKPDEFEPRYYLAIHILYSATTVTSFKSAVNYLLPLVESGLSNQHPEIYRLLAMSYAMGGITKYATKSAYKYFYLCSNNPESISLLDLAYAPYSDYIEIKKDLNKTSYCNYCTGFKIEVKTPVKINSDEPYIEKSDNNIISFFHLYTPYAVDRNGDSIYNDISIVAYNSNFSLNDWLDHKRKMGLILSDEVRHTDIDNCIFTRYYKSDLRNIEYFSRMNEKFEGIITLVKGEKYYYEIIFCATESTFQQNRRYFEDIENNFTLTIPRDVKPGERPSLISIDDYYHNK
jgi:hypothetical protein